MSDSVTQMGDRVIDSGRWDDGLLPIRYKISWVTEDMHSLTDDLEHTSIDGAVRGSDVWISRLGRFLAVSAKTRTGVTLSLCGYNGATVTRLPESAGGAGESVGVAVAASEHADLAAVREGADGWVERKGLSPS
jgi:hypothetical protein